MEKEMKKGFKMVQAKERTVFNDEEQRRYKFVQAAFAYLILNWFVNLFLFKLYYYHHYLIVFLGINHVDYFLFLLLIC